MSCLIVRKKLVGLQQLARGALMEIDNISCCVVPCKCLPKGLLNENIHVCVVYLRQHRQWGADGSPGKKGIAPNRPRLQCSTRNQPHTGGK